MSGLFILGCDILMNITMLRVFSWITLLAFLPVSGVFAAPAGQITLVQPQTGPNQSIVRGVTFSENGRAITFDECPRGRSGCRAGLAAVPR